MYRTGTVGTLTVVPNVTIKQDKSNKLKLKLLTMKTQTGSNGN